MKRRLAVAGAAIVALGLSFAAGRFSAPTKIVEHTRDVQVEAKVARTEVVQHEAHVEAATQKHDVRTVVVTRWLPGGGVEKREASEDASSSTQEAQSLNEKQTERVVERVVYKDREVTKTVTRERPQWSMSALGGIDVGAVIDRRAGMLPLNIVVGAALEHRFVGPMSLGLWGLSSGAVGISARVEF